MRGLGDGSGRVLARVLLRGMGLFEEPPGMRKIFLELNLVGAALLLRRLLGPLARVVELLAQVEDLLRARLGFRLRVAEKGAKLVGFLARGIGFRLETLDRARGGLRLEPEDRCEDGGDEGDEETDHADSARKEGEPTRSWPARLRKFARALRST